MSLSRKPPVKGVIGLSKVQQRRLLLYFSGGSADIRKAGSTATIQVLTVQERYLLLNPRTTSNLKAKGMGINIDLTPVEQENRAKLFRIPVSRLLLTKPATYVSSRAIGLVSSGGPWTGASWALVLADRPSNGLWSIWRSLMPSSAQQQPTCRWTCQT